MNTDPEVLVQLIFKNQLFFCGIFGALGGVVHSLDLHSDISWSVIVNKIIISSSAGLLLFFATYDSSIITPSWRIAASIVAGFYGSALFRYLASLYSRQYKLKLPTDPDDSKDSEGDKEGGK